MCVRLCENFILALSVRGMSPMHTVFLSASIEKEKATRKKKKVA